MNSIETPLITIPLTATDHEVAMEFAKQQPSPQRGHHVYLNTLAIQAVHHYLTWFDIESNPTEGDAWNLPGQLLTGTADLVIPNIGTLECCPVLPNQTRISLSIDALSDRLGCVAVQFNEQLDRVELKGFFPLQTEIAPPELSLNDFHPIETLFESLEPEIIPNVVQRGAALVSHLSEWLQNLVEPSWQTLDELLAQGDFAFARSMATIDRDEETLTVSRFRAVDLGIRINYQPLILSVSVTPINDNERQILVKIRPSGTQIYLPEGLEIAILDESESPIVNLQEFAQDDYSLMQLTFTGERDETFQLRLQLEDEILHLPFVI